MEGYDEIDWPENMLQSNFTNYVKIYAKKGNIPIIPNLSGKAYYCSNSLKTLCKAVLGNKDAFISKASAGCYAYIVAEEQVKAAKKMAESMENLKGDVMLRKFDSSKIISGVNAEKAVEGELYFVGRNIADLKNQYVHGGIARKLLVIRENTEEPRFSVEGRGAFPYLYPLDEDRTLRPFLTCEELSQKAYLYSLYRMGDMMVKIIGFYDDCGVLCIRLSNMTKYTAESLAQMSQENGFNPFVKGENQFRYFGVNKQSGEGMPLLL